jgi:hypothetical protein
VGVTDPALLYDFRYFSVVIIVKTPSHEIKTYQSSQNSNYKKNYNDDGDQMDDSRNTIPTSKRESFSLIQTNSLVTHGENVLQVSKIFCFINVW